MMMSAAAHKLTFVLLAFDDASAKAGRIYQALSHDTFTFRSIFNN
jgi:hypothetical protein